MFERDLEVFADEQRVLLRLMRGSAPADWDLASGGCPGWTVGDVFRHLGLTLTQFAEPRSLPDVRDLGTERANDILVAARRSWSHRRIVDSYATMGPAALDRMRAIGGERVIPLGDLGTHRLADLLKAFIWDHLTHMVCDVVAPDGPLVTPGPPVTERLMAPAVDWIFTGLPQQVSGVPGVDGWIRLDLRGPGGRRVHVAVSNGRFAVSQTPHLPVVATVTSSTAALLRWATRRRDWRDLDVQVSGDVSVVAPVLDRVRVF
jgi:hypothetical protein